MIDIFDTTNCWYCDNIVDHPDQIGLLHLDFPRCFVLIPDNTAFELSSYEDFYNEYCRINWLDPSENASEKEKRNVLDRLWNFLVKQEKKEEDLACDRAIEEFMEEDL